MDRRSEDIETDSTVDNTIDHLDPSDSEVHFRAPTRGRDAGQLLAGNFGPVAVGLQTDADARQAVAPDNFGHVGSPFSPRASPAATPPGAAAVASGVWRDPTYSTQYPAEVMYYGPHHAVSGAAVVDQSAVVGSELGCFVCTRSPRPGVEIVVTTNWGVTTPTTTGAHTNTTATLTSTVTCTTVGGPSRLAYLGSPPPRDRWRSIPRVRLSCHKSSDSRNAFLGR